MATAAASSPPGVKRPRPAASPSSFMLEIATFDGEAQCIEAAAPKQHLGGAAGLTIAAWVRRSRSTSTNCDRVIDFGNGQEQENIVINFKEGVR